VTLWRIPLPIVTAGWQDRDWGTGRGGETERETEAMGGASERWWGPKSEFPWEEDALQHIRDQMPETEPYRAWHTFTFTARTGHVRELDLFLAAPGGLFLVEIKSHPGRATNNGSTWLMRDERVRTLENPLHFTDLKAKELHDQLAQAARKLGVKERIPRIEAAVFLSAPNLRCDFDEFQRQCVFGRDGLEKQTKLPGIWHGFLNQSPRSDARRVTPTLSKQLGKLLDKIGVHGLRKHRRIGPYELEPRAFDAGPTWEDYLAHNTALPGDQPRRVRIYLSELGASTADRESTRRAARREYLALQGISHDGIAAAEQYSDEHEAGPAVVFRHGANWQRLDQFMAEHGADLPVETRVEMIRQLAEALDHAHRRHLYHRALAARCVYVELDGRYPRLRICDWQVAARPRGTGTTTLLGSSGPGASSMVRHVELSSGPYLAPEFASPEAAPAQLDIFGLGALSYLILTGQPPAADREKLAKRLTSERALVPSSVSDAMSPAIDRLVRNATMTQPADRDESVRDFLRDLDEVEEELTAPDRAEEADPLEIGRGGVIASWTIQRVLGKGSTARALLAERDGQLRVLKIALNGSAAQRLIREAAQLNGLTDSHIVRLIDGPVEIGGRTVVVLEQAGERTLADQLRHDGPLTIDELENLGDHLLRALAYLDEQGVWHRDIKPDNLAVRELPKKGRRLVLFDFSLAETPDRVLDVGTSVYLDPFLGTDRRPRYDAAAERYAAAVTLHEMASGELPCWGDGVTEPKLLDPAEEVPQLAEDSFDPVLRDRLIVFFHRALRRDPDKRFGSLKEMTRAWADVFRDLDQAPPLTTRHTVDRAEPADLDAARDEAARAATAGTPLAAAGLTARALSIAQQQLNIATVGELVKTPAARIMRLRGVGLGPRNELVRRAREWRRRLEVAEPAEVTPPAAAGRGPEAAGQAPAEVDWARATVDQVVRQLVPKFPPGKGSALNQAEIRVIRLLLALPDEDGTPSPVRPWAARRQIAEKAGLTQADVTELMGKARERWAKSVPAVTPLREDVVAILTEHGRVLESGQIAAALLARRGSELDDPAARLAYAAACVRAAIDTETRRENPRLLYRRQGDRVLVAVSAEDDPSAPSEGELIDYAVGLSEQADELAARDPLPSVTAVLAGLRAVTQPDGLAPLSDTDLVALAAAAARDAAVTARLELYPRSLSPTRALRLAQAPTYLGGSGLTPDELRVRVLARFPELTRLPEATGLRRVLLDMGYDIRISDGRYVLPSGTQVSSTGWVSTGGGAAYGAGYGAAGGAGAREEVLRRLDEARRHGGFVAVKTRLPYAAAVRDALRGLEGVTAIDVTAEFVAMLRSIVAEQGRPRWETVLAADSADASPAARTGFGRLLDETWRRLDQRIRAADGIALLHDATPLARYTGGSDLLARLAAAARQADEAPHGLWLLCPMADPAGPPRLDGLTVGVIPGDAEQFAVPSSFVVPADSRRVS
jgi:serine/threonine protein kinase